MVDAWLEIRLDLDVAVANSLPHKVIDVALNLAHVSARIESEEYRQLGAIRTRCPEAFGGWHIARKYSAKDIRSCGMPSA